MSHQRRGNLDYAVVAKKGFLLGVVLFALGAVGEILGHAYLALPSVAEQAFFGMEVAGIAIGFLAPVVFGAVLPLTE